MKLIVASNNQGKLAEMARILESLHIEVAGLAQAGIQIEIEETGTTFAENARIKAQTIYEMTKQPTIADDSGLEVAHLKGAPGVYTARFAGENASDEENVQKLLTQMQGVDNRAAQFVSAICCVLDANTTIEVRGVCQGEIGTKPLGEKGFGYDPIFMVNGKSFAQMDEEEKDEISHRGKAMEAFYQKIKTYIQQTKQ